MNKRNLSNFFWVGIFTLLVIAFTLWAMLKMTGKQSDATEYNSYYGNVTGLGFGTPVYYEGYRVGQVETIEPEFHDQGVNFKVIYSVPAAWKIPVDAVAQIQSAGLLSDMSINIKAGKATVFFEPHATIPGQMPEDLMGQLSKVSGDIGQIAEQQISPMLEMLYQRLDNITAQVEKDLPATLENLRQTSHSLNQVALSAQQLLSPQNIDNMSQIISNVKTMSNQAQTTISSLNQTIDNANGLVGDARLMFTDDNSQLAHSLNNIARMTSDMSQQLDSILNELESASSNLNQATNEIRKRPSRLIFSGKQAPDDEL